MKLKKIALSLLFLTILIGCQQEKRELSFGKPIQFVTQILTRSAMESGFTVDDNIGIFMLKRDAPSTPATFSPTGDNWINNIEFYLATDEKSWNSVYPIYWDDQTSTVDVVGYYPYRSLSADTNDMTNLPIQVAKNQSHLDSLRKSDFLYATHKNITPSNRNSEIALGFKHKLCKLTVNLDITANGYPLNSEPMVMANNVYTDAIINLSDGSVRCGRTQADVILHYDAENQIAEAILPPQTIKNGTLITVIFKDISLKAYTYTIKEDLEMKEGKEYIINFSNPVDSKIILPVDSISIGAKGEDIQTYLNKQYVGYDRYWNCQSNVDITIEAPSWVKIEHNDGSIGISEISDNFTPSARKGEIVIKGGGITKKIIVYQNALIPTTRSLILTASNINSPQWVGRLGKESMQHFDTSDLPDWLTYNINNSLSSNTLYVTALKPNKSNESRSYVFTFYRGEAPEYVYTIIQDRAVLTCSNYIGIYSNTTSAQFNVTHDLDLTLTYPDCSWVEFPVKSGGILPQEYIINDDGSYYWKTEKVIPLTFKVNNTGTERSTTFTISNGVESKKIDIVQTAW